MMKRLIPAMLAAVMLAVVPLSAGLSMTTAAASTPKAPAVSMSTVDTAKTSSPCIPGTGPLCDLAQWGVSKFPKKAEALGNFGPVKAIGSLAESVGELGTAVRKLSKFTPSDITEMWAQKSAEMAMGMMGKISDFQKKVTKPGWGTKWWTQQYAVMAALGLMVFAFMLVIVTAKISRSRGEDAISGIALLRSAGIRLWMVPTMIVFAPAFLMEVFGLTSGLASVFAGEGKKSAGGAMEIGMGYMGNIDSTMSAIGGPLAAIVIFTIMGVAAFIVLVLLVLATWGLNVLSLFVPIVLAMYVYPPWRPAQRKLIGLMLGLLLMPTMINLVYWTFWSASKNVLTGTTGDVLGALLFVLVGSVMLVLAPLMAAWLIPMIIPEGGAMAGGLGGGAAAGVLTGGMAGRLGSGATGSGADRAKRLSSHARNHPSSGMNGPRGAGSDRSSSSTRGSGQQHARPDADSGTNARGSSTNGSASSSPSPASGGSGGKRAAAGAGAGKVASGAGRGAVGAGRRVKEGTKAHTQDMVNRNANSWSEER